MVPGQHDRRSAVMATLSALVSGLDAELRRLGYKDSTMVWYRGCWRRMEKYFAARGIGEFSLDAAIAWVDEACGFFAKEQAGTLKPNDIYLFRVAAMLGEYAAHGAVLRRYNRSVSKLDGPGAEAVARFQARGDRELFVFGFSPDGRYLTTTHFPGFALTVWDVDRNTIAVAEPGPVAGGAAVRETRSHVPLASKVRNVDTLSEPAAAPRTLHHPLSRSTKSSRQKRWPSKT